jgi:protein-S-isoprenylcysteine O-methyltransferase Ste14
MDVLDFLPVTITWVTIISQIILTFVLWTNYYDIYGLVIVGYIFWLFSVVCGLLPIYMFRKKGGVSKGSSYIKTTSLVDTGIYAIVRHPQFLAGILWSVALAFISQYWVIDILVIPVVVATYIDAIKANVNLIQKFGDEYREYMDKVPNLNVFWGIIKLLRRRIKKSRIS